MRRACPRPARHAAHLDAGPRKRRVPRGHLNNISALAPRNAAQSRFDEIFFVDLPTPTCDSALFGLHLKKRSRDVTSFDLPTLATASEGFSGGGNRASHRGRPIHRNSHRIQQLTTDILLAKFAAPGPSASPAPKISKPSATGPKPAPVPAD